MKIAIDEYETETRSLDEIIESETLVPYRIGSCSRVISRQLGSREPCSNRVMSDDLDAMEMPGNEIWCGCCVNALTGPRPITSDHDPERVKAKKSQRIGKPSGTTSPRLRKGEDLRR